MKKIIFHCGMAKTGSTTIQFFFAANKKLLKKEKSIFYPMIDNGNKKVISCETADGKKLYFRKAVRNGIGISNFIRNKNILDARKHLKKLIYLFEQSCCETMIISDEIFSFLQPEKFNFTDILANYEITILFLLKRPIYYQLSAWSQISKHWTYTNIHSTNHNFHTWMNQDFWEYGNIFNWHLKYNKIFNVVFKPLDDNDDVLDIIKNYLNLYSIDKFLVNVKQQNSSISFNKTILLNSLDVLIKKQSVRQLYKYKIIKSVDICNDRAIDYLSKKEIKTIVDNNYLYETQIAKTLNKKKIFKRKYPQEYYKAKKIKKISFLYDDYKIIYSLFLKSGQKNIFEKILMKLRGVKKSLMMMLN